MKTNKKVRQNWDKDYQIYETNYKACKTNGITNHTKSWHWEIKQEVSRE